MVSADLHLKEKEKAHRGSEPFAYAELDSVLLYICQLHRPRSRLCVSAQPPPLADTLLEIKALC